MKTEIEIVRIAGYKFVFEITDLTFMSRCKSFSGGIIYDTALGMNNQAAKQNMIEKILWNFKR